MKQSIKTIYHQIIRELNRRKISNAKQEAEMLLGHFLDKDPVWLISNSEKIISKKKSSEITRALKKRLTGAPLPYILGEIVFCGMKLKINNHVLVPRMETEILVNETLKIASSKINPVIIDVGTGSGAIAIAVGKNLVTRRVQFSILALDISDQAIKLAKKNITNNKLDNNIKTFKSDLLNKVNLPADIIVANLPYIPTGKIGRLADPRIALDGGPDGIRLIEKLLEQIHDRKLLKPGGSIILEIGHGQAKKIIRVTTKLFKKNKLSVTKDLAGYERVLTIINEK